LVVQLKVPITCRDRICCRVLLVVQLKVPITCRDRMCCSVLFVVQLKVPITCRDKKCEGWGHVRSLITILLHEYCLCKALYAMRYLAMSITVIAPSTQPILTLSSLYMPSTSKCSATHSERRAQALKHQSNCAFLVCIRDISYSVFV